MLARLNRTLCIASFVKVKEGIPPINQTIFTNYYKDNAEELSKHYNELTQLGFRNQGVAKLLKQKPQLFKSPSGDLQIKGVVNSLTQKFGRSIINVVQNNPDLLDQQKYSNIKKTLQSYGFTDQQIQRINNYQPQVLNDRLSYRIDTFKSILKNYLNMSDLEANEAIAKQPFILRMKAHRFRETIRKLIVNGIPEAEIRDMLDLNIDIFQMGVDRIGKLFQIPEGWNVSKETIKKIILENKDYLAQCPYEMIAPKINILNDFKIPKRIAKVIFEQYPIVFVSSIASLQAKLNLIKERMKIPLQLSDLFPYLLSRNYNGVLRPRFEVMQRLGLPINKQQFSCSDEEFCKDNNISFDILSGQKAKYQISSERDYKKKFYTHTLQRMKSA